MTNTIINTVASQGIATALNANAAKFARLAKQGTCIVANKNGTFDVVTPRQTTMKTALGTLKTVNALAFM
jgi:hypothetical protein